MSSHPTSFANTLISVVMPCLNAGEHLREAVACVLAQALPATWRLELLLVDDGSTDRLTLQLIDQAREDPRVRVLRHTQPQGVSRARNRAIAAAQGSLIAFLDADDVWAPHHLATHIEALQTHSAAFSASDYELVDEAGRSTGTACQWTHPRKGPWLQAQLGDRPSALFVEAAELFIRACPVWICATVVRREALADVPVFNESLALAEDLELWIRLARQHDFVFCRELTAKYRQVAGSLTHAAGPPRLDLVTATMYENLAKRHEFSAHRALMRKVAGGHYLSAAYGYQRAAMRSRAFVCLLNALRCVPLKARLYRQLLGLACAPQRLSRADGGAAWPWPRCGAELTSCWSYTQPPPHRGISQLTIC